VVLCGTVCKAACTGWCMPAAQQPQRTIKDTMIEQLGGCIPFGVWLVCVCVCGGVVCKRMKTVKKKVEEREKKKKNGNGTTKKQPKERKTENLNPYISERTLCVGF